MIKQQENEQLLVATLLKSKESRNFVFSYIDHIDYYFTTNECASIYKTIYRLHASGKEVNVDSVSSFCAHVEFKVIDYIAKTYGEIPYANLNSHLDLIRENALENDFNNKYFTSIVDNLNNKEITLDDKLKELKVTVDEISKRKENKDSGPKDMSVLTTDYQKELDIRKKGLSFYTTGDMRLDNSLSYGYAPRQITLMVGRPSNGKSMVALDNARRLANLGITTMVFNLEMRNVNSMDRLISMGTQINVSKLTKDIKNITRDEESKLTSELTRMKTDMNLYMDEDPILDLDLLKAKIGRIQERTKKEYMVIYVDLFTKLVEFSEAESALDFEKVCNSVQKMTQQMGVHSILILQINRSADKEKLKNLNDLPKIYPMVSQIKNAGAFEEVADNIFLISRPSNYLHQYEWGEYVPDYIRLEIGKQRHGMTSSFSNVILYQNPKNYIGLITPDDKWDPLVVKVNPEDIKGYINR